MLQQRDYIHDGYAIALQADQPSCENDSGSGGKQSTISGLSLRMARPSDRLDRSRQGRRTPQEEIMTEHVEMAAKSRHL